MVTKIGVGCLHGEDEEVLVAVRVGHHQEWIASGHAGGGRKRVPSWGGCLQPSPPTSWGPSTLALRDLSTDARRLASNYSGLPTVLSLYAFCMMKKACFFFPSSERRPLRL